MGSESTQFFDIDLTEYQNPSIDEHHVATPLSPSNNNTDEAAAASSSGAATSSNTDRAAAPSKFTYILKNLRGRWGPFAIIEQDNFGLQTGVELRGKLRKEYEKKQDWFFKLLYRSPIDISYVSVSLS